MAYMLQLGQSMQKNLRRVADEQLEKAIQELEAQGDEAQLAHNIHQVRKRMKRLRGLLRLMRNGLAGAIYRHENGCFRNTARLLAGARDAQVLVDTFDALVTTSDADAKEMSLASVREMLDQERQATLHTDENVDGRMRKAAAMLQAARQRVPDWQLKKTGFPALAGGLQQTYGRGRQAFARAYDTLSTANFHEWRKAVKYHWYHSRLLRRLWPIAMKARADTLEELAELLGDDHDLSVFQEALASRSQITAEQRVALQQRAEARQQALRVEARRLGRLLYADPPKPLRKRFKAYWQAQVTGV